MKIDEFFDLFPDYEVTFEQLVCARYLQGHSELRFLYDFGFENASALAFAMIESEPAIYDYPMGLS